MFPEVLGTARVLEWVVRVSWQAGVLTLAMLLAQWLFRRRLSPAWRYNLWLLVVFKLVVPAWPETGFSIFNALPLSSLHARDTAGHSLALRSDQIGVKRVDILTPGGKSVSADVLPVDDGSADPAAPHSHTHMLRKSSDPNSSRSTERDWNPYRNRGWRIFAGIWLLGMIALCIPLAWQTWRLHWQIGGRRQVTESCVLELLEDCKDMMGVRVPLAVVETARVKSPVLYGFLRPRLLLPQGLIQSFARDELRFIFLHELGHLKRKDILVNWLATAAQIVHWFNPLVWLACFRMRADRELACDHLALSHMRREETESYGETVIKLLEKFSQPAVMPSIVGILEEKSQIRQRIEAIARFEGSPRSSRLAIVLWVMIAAVTLTEAKSTRPHMISGSPVARFRGVQGLDLEKALAGGGLLIAAETNLAALLTDGVTEFGELDGLGGDTWELRSSPSRDFARMSYSAVWTGKEMLIWGGGANGHYFNDGARYTPGSDSWRPITTNGAPCGRWFHAAVWTGREMLIWGGRSRFDIGLSNQNDGAKYDPVKDQWTPISEENAPEARSQLAAVWTGTELIVWGGVGNGGTPAQGGGRYDPIRNSWSALPENASPAPRSEPAYVWTGEEMIVWGGVTYHAGELTFRSGGRYRPAESAWKTLSLEQAPPAATGMPAFWTGSEMLVWGGRVLPQDQFLNTGARYDPKADKWNPMSSNGAPSGRLLYSAVWTGKELVVWGGLGGSDPTKTEAIVNTGALYDLSLDRWFPMTLRAPEVRHFGRHDIGVWTGDGMLVFGGSNLKMELHTMYFWRPPRVQHLYGRRPDDNAL